MNPDRLLTDFDRIAEAPDAVPRLRRFILDLAVRGKLVDQDPHDEPAGEFAERFAGEKARLIQSEKIRKGKSAPPITKELEPYNIPETWEWVRLDTLCQLITKGSSPKWQGVSYVSKDNGLVFITSENVGNYSLRKLDGLKYVESRFRDIEPRSMLHRGDILLNLVGASIGRTALYDLDVDANINQAVALLRLIDVPERPVVDFLLHYLNSPTAIDLMMGSRVTSAQPNISLTNAREFPIPLPPLAEQHRIVAKVDELMALCDRLEAAQNKREQRRDRLAAASLNRINQPAPSADGEAATAFREHACFHLAHLPRLTTRPEHIKSLRQTILNLAVRGKLVEQDPNDGAVKSVALKITIKRRGQIREAIEEPFGLPSGWAWRAVDTIADQVTDGEHATPPRITEKEVPLVTAKNVRDGFMDYAKTDWVSYSTAAKAWSRCRPAVGDLLLVCVGATTGRLTVLREPQDMVLVRSVALIRPSRDVDAEYLERAIRSPVLQAQIWASVKAAAQPCLYINRIKPLLVPLPPLTEQHRIVAKVDELMAVCDQLEAQFTSTRTDSRRLLEAVLREALAPAMEEAA